MSVPVVSRTEYEGVGELQIRMQLALPEALSIEKNSQLGEAHRLWVTNSKAYGTGFSKARWGMSQAARDSIALVLDVAEPDPSKYLILEHRDAQPFNNFTGLSFQQLPLGILKRVLSDEVIYVKSIRAPVIHEVHQWLETGSEKMSWRAWVQIYLPLFCMQGDVRKVAVVLRVIERNIVPLSSALQQSILVT